MSSAAAVLATMLTGFAFLALIMHCGSCILLALKALALRLKRGKGGRQKQPGVTLLLPIDGSAPQALQACLQAGFAESYQPKEIIFCAFRQNALSAAAVRAARDSHAAQSSLLVSAGTENQAADIKAARLNALVKGFKAARYDYVAAALPNAVLPADYIAGFLNAAGGAKNRPAALVCAPLWAAGARGFKARLAALFFNRAQMRLALASCFGAGAANAAPDGRQAALWNYETLHKTGGADVFARAFAAHGAAAAATEIVRAEGGAIHYAGRALPTDFSAAALGGKNVFAAAAEDLRFCRRFAPKSFYAELLLTPFLPFAAGAAACALGGFGGGGLIAFIFAWYAAELLFCALWGARAQSYKTAGKTYALLPARDMLAPFLWLAAALKGRDSISEK